MAKDFSKKTTLMDNLVEFATKHPIIFWGGSLLWIILPDPLPIIDELILSVILIMVGIKSL